MPYKTSVAAKGRGLTSPNLECDKELAENFNAARELFQLFVVVHLEDCTQKTATNSIYYRKILNEVKRKIKLI